MSSVDASMASHSGITATGSDSSKYVKKIVQKDYASYGPEKAKITSIRDAKDVW